ncbi:protein disulfide oxidoreductase [Nitrincola alkalisediminis]
MKRLFNRYAQLPRRYRWSVEALLFILLIAGVRAYQAPSVDSGYFPLPESQLLSGGNIALGDYAGQPLLVVVWADWCRICRIELPTIHLLTQDYPVITLAMQSGSDNDVKAFLTANNLVELPVINDPSGELAQRLGVSVLPTLFVLDSQGEIAFSEVGLTSRWGIKARMWWAALKG